MTNTDVKICKYEKKCSYSVFCRHKDPDNCSLAKSFDFEEFLQNKIKDYQLLHCRTIQSN